MKTIFLVCLVSFFKVSYAQNYQGMVEAEKYAKVWKKCQKKLQKEPTGIEELYFSALILSKTKSKSLFNPKEALTYYNKTIKEYNNCSDPTKLAKLDKIPLNYTVLRILEDSISSGGLLLAVKTNTEDAFIEYLNIFTMANQKDKDFAISKRNELAFGEAQKTNTIESFETFMTKYPDAQEFGSAEKERDKLAYSKALSYNTIDAFKNFLKNYPKAIQVNDAWEKIYSIAYESAVLENSIQAYESFIYNYPKAKQVVAATEKIHELAFEEAKILKNIEKWNDFINKYPSSKQIQIAKNLLDDLIFEQNTNSQNWISYKKFIENYPKNRNIQNARSIIYELGFKNEDPLLLDYIIANYDYNDTIIQMHYNLYTKDGELSTMKKYQVNYPNFYNSQVDSDMDNAFEANKLLLHLPYNKRNYLKHVEYLKNIKNKDLAFVVIQRILSPYLVSKQFDLAVEALDRLPIDVKDKNVINLRTIISSKIDNSVKITACSELNTLGNEFSPIISSDEKKIFYCGENRSDNLGGEDIFEANLIKSNFTSPYLNDLSTSTGNEAPVSISSDGTKMFLFQTGKLFYSEKNQFGWSGLKEIDQEINNGDWQGDAMLSSDGNYLFFSAYRKGEVFNINNMSDKVYHGDILYPTDIFFSKKDSDDNWSYPQNLGETINTRYCERFPFLHPDMKTLYFSSDGHGGLGKLDVFMTTRLSDSCWTCWSEPINLGKEINTIESDAGYKITTSGQEAYFARNNRKLNESSVLYVLDVSGSMSGEKIEELKIVSKSTIQDVINNNAEVSIVAFDGTCNSPITYYLPFTKDYNEVEVFIDNLTSDGGTPMYEAYYQASKLLKNNARSTSKSKVLVLMTDGDATSCNQLSDVLEKLKREKSLFKTQTIAYGVQENSKAYFDLNDISSFSSGDFYHAASTNELGIAFEQANKNIYQIVSGPDNKDIYKINLPPHLRPDIVAKIEGTLKNSKNEPISTTIRWEDLENNKIIGSAKTDPSNGSYFIVLPMGKNYGYFIEDSTYFPLSQN
ncbi:MAG: VWA domain-containing protein, partial [Bacteroidota bacterium]